MKFVLIFLIFAAILVEGCAAEPTELNAHAFNAYFSGQRKCGVYVESVINPVAKELAARHTIVEMREWLHSHPSESFAKLATDVQEKTLREGVIYPRREADQLKVTSQIYGQMSSLPGFDGSSCGVDVREQLMKSLFLSIGGEKAFVIDQLRRNGVNGNTEQQWVLLVSLFAGHLTSDLVD